MNSNRIQITLPGGRSVLVDPVTADRVRKAIAKNQVRDREIARELKQEHLLPSGFFGPRNVKFISASSVEPIVPIPLPIVDDLETRFQEHLKREGL